MGFLELLNNRGTTYEFNEEDVTDETLNKIIEAGRLAPSAMNSQPWTFVVVKNNELIDEIMEKCYYGNFHTTPKVLIAIIAEPYGENEPIHQKLSEKAGYDSAEANCYIPGVNMIYEASDIGLDSCLLTPVRAEQLLGVPEGKRVVLLVGLGHAKQKTYSGPRHRKPTEEIVRYEKYE